MLRHRRAARAADVVHYQWLTIPVLDAFLLPAGPARVMTAHGFLRSAESGLSAARALERMDAVVALSQQGAARLREDGVDPARIHVIPHGAFDYLTRLPEESPLPRELQGAEEGDPELRRDPPVQGDRRAPAGVRRRRGRRALDRRQAPGRRPRGAHHLAAAAPGPVRMLTRFVEDLEIPAIMRRADIVALPYRDVDQSGVLYTALAFGKPIVASAVGGFGEVLQAMAPVGWWRRATRTRSPPRSASFWPSRPSALGWRPRSPRRVARTRGTASPSAPWTCTDSSSTDNPRVVVVEIVFWLCVALLVHTHVTYPLSLALLVRLRRADKPPQAAADLPLYR